MVLDLLPEKEPRNIRHFPQKLLLLRFSSVDAVVAAPLVACDGLVGVIGMEGRGDMGARPVF